LLKFKEKNWQQDFHSSFQKKFEELRTLGGTPPLTLGDKQDDKQERKKQQELNRNDNSNNKQSSILWSGSVLALEQSTYTRLKKPVRIS
jgi:hypothetical protein